MSKRLIACVLVPHFLACIAARRSDAPTTPVVVATSRSDRAMVIDLCPQAMRCGVRVGMPVLQARQRCRSLASTAATLFDAGDPDAVDPIERASARRTWRF